MGKLAYLKERLEKAKISPEDVEKGNDEHRKELSNIMAGGFTSAASNLESALSRLVTESDKAQNKSLAGAVDGVVKAVAVTQEMFSEGIAQISQEVKLSQDILTDEISSINKEIGKVSSGVSQNLAGQIDNLAKSVKRLPTQFPPQKEIDLSDITYALKTMPDVSPQLKRIEDRMKSREFIFDVQRDPISNLIDKIVVKEI